jgi:hypothetical protein
VTFAEYERAVSAAHDEYLEAARKAHEAQRLAREKFERAENKLWTEYRRQSAEGGGK